MKAKTVKEAQEEKAKRDFEMKVWDYCKDKLDIYPKWLLRDFCNYWTAKNDNGKKMYFQMEKKWSTPLRLSTWRQRTLKDPRWDGETKTYPNYLNMRLVKNMDTNEWAQYKKHLISKGWQFGEGAGGPWALSPNNERIWLT